MHTVELPHLTPALRAQRFGTSHTAVLFDEHPFQTAAQYWLDKRDGTRQPETAAMVRGTFLEPSILKWYNETQNKYQFEMCTSAYLNDYIVSVPDAITERGTVLLSIKTTARRTDEPEPYWIWQAQAEMMMTGAELTVFAWLYGNMELKTAEIEADEALFFSITTQTREFVEALKRKEMPESYQRRADDVTRQYQETTPVPCEGGDEALELVEEYSLCKARAKQYKEEADDLRDKLFNMAEDHEAITCDGDLVAQLKQRAGAQRFDSKEFDLAYPGLRDQYMTRSSPTRVLTIPKSIIQAASERQHDSF